jgi:hypothetical protein
MFYSGGPALGWKIGYASSKDGRIWHKDDENNPVLELGLTGSWDSESVGYHNVCFNSDSTGFDMWYTGAEAAAFVGDIGFATSVIKEKPRSQYTIEDWRKEIDEYWGEGDPTDKKLAIFDEIWNKVDDGFNTFQNLDIDWDDLREKYRPEIEAGVSQGRFVGIINSMARQLQETHLWLYYKPINLAPKLEPGEPVMSISSFANNRHFGATLTPLPDSSLLVYKAFSNHPLGLVPGDIVLGYEGVPWKKLYKDLLTAELPLKLNGITGSTKEACEHINLSSAGLNWHLYDTIDIVKHESGDTLHLSTAVLAGQTGRIMGSDQVPVNGISFWADEGTEVLSRDTTSDYYWTKPDINADYLTYGIIDNTDIGYIYLATASNNNVSNLPSKLLQVFKELDKENIKGVIFDLRYNTGGLWSAMDNVFAYIYKNGFKVTNMFTRSSTEDHLLMKPWIIPGGPDGGTSVVTVRADSTTSYNKPIALLTGPGCVSAGEYSVLKFKKYDSLRVFGKETGGTVTVGNSINPLSTSGNWLFGQAQGNTKLYEDSSRYLSHTGLEVDEKIWLDQDSVAQGIDNVVSRAVDWINGITTWIDQFSGKNIPGEIRLFQNYPNPYNPTTKIRYQIPTTGLVSLRVYNLLGEVVATLVNVEKSAGNYYVEFIASGLPSGIYFYRLQAGNFVETRKMILLK